MTITMPPKLKPNGYWQGEFRRLIADDPTPNDKSLSKEVYLAIDTETTGSQWDKPYEGFTAVSKPFAISACDNTGKTWYVEWEVDPHTREVAVKKTDIDKFRKLFASYETLVFHNSKFDIRALQQIGIDLSDRLRNGDCEDTLGMSHVADSIESHGLKSLGIKYLNMLDDDEEALKDAVAKCRRSAGHHDIPIGPVGGVDYWLPAYMAKKGILPPDAANVCSEYSVRDAIRTALIYRLYRKVLTKDKLWFNYERERRVLVPIVDMESANQGLRLRPGAFEKARSRIRKDWETGWETLGKISGDSNLNPRSNVQVCDFLFQRMGMVPRNFTEGGAPSLDKDARAEMLIDLELHPKKICKKPKNIPLLVQFIENFDRFKSANTALTYLDSYYSLAIEKVRGGVRGLYLYPEFNPWGTRTTRLSSSNPNGQNIGAKNMDVDIDMAHAFIIRSVFGPAPGRLWWSMDYNQLELRILAFVSKDPSLSKILNEGVDRHQLTCDAINALRKRMGLAPISRKIAKNINFAWGYGAGDPKLSAMAGVPAEEFNAAMREAYPGVIRFMSECIEFAREHGFIDTLCGYRLQVPRHEPYKATNYKVQGTAGDFGKNSMISISDYRRGCRYDFDMLLQIHDEFIFETDKKSVPMSVIRDLRDIVQSAGDFVGCPTPVSVEKIITSWDDAKELAL